MSNTGNTEENGQKTDTGYLLRQLRDRVRRLTEEVDRLREDNAAMAERLEELEQRVDHEGTLLMLDEGPEELREKVTSYIQVIDQYLGKAR